VATPAYLQKHGTPKHPAELMQHSCLTLSSDASQTRGWAFKAQNLENAETPEVFHVRPHGPLDCSDGQVLRSWCLASMGIAWRSTWEVENDIRSGQLVEVLADFAAPPNGIYGVFPQRKHLPLRLRLWIDFLKHHYSLPATWQSAP
jgi:DNA-binding transcriptional LysR family regulator